MVLNRSLLAVIPCALLLFAACGSSDGESEVDVTDASSAETGQGDPDPDDPTDPDEPVVAVPTLPIGGGSYPLDGSPGVVCADVSWLWPSGDSPSVPEGVSVVVTGYEVEPEVFEPADAACDGASCLDGFVFTADSTSCQVAMLSLVPWTDEQEGEDAVLRLSGEMTCSAEPCELEDVEGGDTEAFLTAPEVDTESESESESESTESTDPAESG
ncbi:hypothetical protein ACIO3S_08080 [Nocardioides sp. NPDC087217]|uniref:hypothetical protein n=1 Tax=Nocardioides sp. NPDC087217 TaxID=3364335 RepID=UPI00381471F0